MSAAPIVHNLIADALTGMVKQIKAVRYYPSGHPALETAARECLQGFQPLLSEGSHLSLDVRKDRFLFKGQPIAKGNQLLDQLAKFCFARRINYLTILNDLTAQDLNYFVQFLNLPPVSIQQCGGIQSILEKARVKTLWVNQKDLDVIFEQRQVLEQEPPPADQDPMAIVTDLENNPPQPEDHEVCDLNKLVGQMDQLSDFASYCALLEDLVPAIRLNMTDANRGLIFRAFWTLCRHATELQRADDWRMQAQHALGELTTADMIDYLIDTLLRDDIGENSQQALCKILGYLRVKSVKRLAERLSAESHSPRRKRLCDALTLCGPEAIPTLAQLLQDNRSEFLRCAIIVLGDIRDEKALDHLPPLLRHKDPHIRRETIRALAKIGGPDVINLLVNTAESGDQVQRRQALLSLGALRAATAVPALRNILKRPNWSHRTLELKKDALKALAEIRAPEAIPELIKIIDRKNLFYPKVYEDLRIAAVTVLGEIGERSCSSLLERLLSDKSTSVARAAALAIKQIEKVD
ncbi:MAG: HEAT repeat domain-containing protein [Deltaproteobacteria bacterium]|jgi:HEAT repeat protein|nr:HEAT repeat domain-containing protein [Deltaproteobacteria bacterium]